VTTLYRSALAYRNANTYTLDVTIGTLLPMYDGSVFTSDLVVSVQQYTPPTTDYLILDWGVISTTNPAYVANPTDYFSLDLTPRAGPQSIGSVTMYSGDKMYLAWVNTNLGTVIAYDGEIASFGLVTHPTAYFAPVFKQGEVEYSNLSTTAVLTGDGDLVEYTGEVMTWALTPDIPWRPTPVFLQGETFASSLATHQLITAWFYDATTLVSSLTTDLQWQPSFTMNDSTAMVLPTIAAQQSLPPLYFPTGEILAPFALGNLENYYFHDASALASTLSTTVDFTADGNLVFKQGEVEGFSLYISPSEPLTNQIKFLWGEKTTVSLLTTPHAEFSVFFYAGQMLQVDFSTSTHQIDLSHQRGGVTDSSYFWRDTDVIWMDLTVDVQNQPGAVSYGLKSFMTVSITFQENLTPNPMLQGETFEAVKYFDFFSGSAFDGTSMTFQLESVQDIQLCLGNFIPDGAAVSADLATVDNFSCSVDSFKDATHFDAGILRNNIQFAPVFKEGLHMYSSLEVPTPWFFLFLDGERMFVPSNVEFSPVFYDGEFLSLEFKPDTYIFLDSTKMTLPTFTTDYTVTFVETGCLSNTYVNQQATPVIPGIISIPGIEPYRAPASANIELRPFYHQILAECF